MLTKLAALAVKDGTCDAVATFAPVELRQRAPAFRFVVDIGQSVQALVDATELGNGQSRNLSASCKVDADARFVAKKGSA